VAVISFRPGEFVKVHRMRFAALSRVSVFPFAATARRVLFALGAIGFLAVPLSGKQLSRRLPLPETSARAEALKIVREVYGKEYEQAKTSAEKLALVDKLLRQAAMPDNSPADRYALLYVARNIALQNNDLATAFRIVDEMAAVFEVDPLEAKVAVLTGFAKVSRTTVRHKTAARHGLLLLDEAMRLKKSDLVDRLAKLAEAEARRARDSALSREVRAQIDGIQQAAAAVAKVQAATAVLKDNPSDPQANLTVGEHLCFVEADWQRGLPMLARGADPTLKALAEKELAGPTDPQAQAAVADAWWEAAENETGAAKTRLQSRAVHWYRRAVAGLTGLSRIRVQKRIQAAEAADRTPVAHPSVPAGRYYAAKIYVCCDDEFVMCVNGNEIMKGTDFGLVYSKDYRLAKGDVITVLAKDRGGGRGFSCVIRFGKRRTATTASGWTAYVAASEIEWFKPQGIARTYPVIPRPQCAGPGRVKNASGIRVPAIWGQGDLCYLVYRVR